MSQTNAHKTNQQTTEQQKASRQRDQEENNQTNIFVPDTQEPDDALTQDQHFLFQGHNHATRKSKGYPKIINLSSKPLTER